MRILTFINLFCFLDLNETPNNPCLSVIPSIDPKTSVGTAIFTLSSTDPDNAKKQKQKISYILKSQDSPFEISNGKIVVESEVSNCSIIFQCDNLYTVDFPYCEPPII